MIKVIDIAYVRFSAPNLKGMKTFLEDFGLTIAEFSEDRLVARGTGAAPVLHVTELGDARFISFAFRAETLADLEKLATAEGAEVEELDLPGGGYVVRLTDPDGHEVEVVAGQLEAPLLEMPKVQPWNRGNDNQRLRTVKRFSAGPAHVLRLGHVVINVSNFRISEQWYKSRFGLITSDEIQYAPEIAIGAFLRCDLGEELADHHTIFLAQPSSGPGFNHAAFEVADLDDLLVGHYHLKKAGYHAEWGVGRHILGSQVFDYWRDPWGHTLEHMTDGDLFTAADGSNIATLEDLLDVQWGPAAPPTMGTSESRPL